MPTPNFKSILACALSFVPSLHILTNIIPQQKSRNQASKLPAMEVVVLSPTLDFDFINASRSNSPRVITDPPYYFSAPASPSHISQFYEDFNGLLRSDDAIQCPTVPFAWEERPGVPKSTVEDGYDFAFDVSEEWETASQLSAEELFDGGVIKPLMPPPRVQEEARIRGKGMYKSTLSRSRKKFHGAFSPRGKIKSNKVTDPFSTSVAAETQRGREKGVNVPKFTSRRATRSLSPIRDGEYPWAEDEIKQQSNDAKAPTPSGGSGSSLSESAKGSKKWRLKDLLLFRSASEGRADEKDQLKKYTAAFRHSSFRAIEIPGHGSGSRRGPVSAHELHYTMNRAVSQDLKKKTFLPYKQGILGRLAFNPAVHAMANGFGFSN